MAICTCAIIGSCSAPELVHHQRNRNQEQHNKPSAKFCAISEQNTQATGKGQHTGKRSIRLSPRVCYSSSPISEWFSDNCWLTVEGIPDPFPLAGGDCFLLAPGSSYTLRGNLRTRARNFCEVPPRNGGQVIEYGGGGAPTTIISGWFRFCATSMKPMMHLLPPLVLVKADQAKSLALHTTLKMLASEMAHPVPGSELVVNRLADMLCTKGSAYWFSREVLLLPGGQNSRELGMKCARRTKAPY
jgi:hypothetical protein